MEPSELFYNYNCLKAIYAHLKLVDLVEFASITPTSAQVVADQIRHRYEKFTIKNTFLDECNSLERLLLVFQHIGPSLQNLTIRKLRTNDIVSAYSIVDILNMCPELKILKLIGQDLRTNTVYGRFCGVSQRPVELKSLLGLLFTSCRVTDTALESFVGGCSDKLKLISVVNTKVTGEFFKKAPNSLRYLKLVDSIVCTLSNYVINYVRRNQNLKALIFKEKIIFNVKDVSHMLNIETLVLECYDLYSYKSLSKLTKLKDLQVQTRDNSFRKYFETMTPEHRLTKLTLALRKMDISPEFASSFARLSSLHTLKLQVMPKVTNENLILPHLAALSRLECLELDDGEFDMELLYAHVTQIKQLTIIANVDSINLDNLFNMRNLTHVELSITEPPTVFANDVIQQAITRALVGIARTESMTTLYLATSYIITLDELTLIAFLASNLRKLILNGMFGPTVAIRLLRNLAHLVEFGHSGVSYTNEMQEEIRAIRPENPIIIRTVCEKRNKMYFDL